MDVSDEDVDRELSRVLKTRDPQDVPGFAAVWTAAERRYAAWKRSRRALAAAVIAGVGVMVMLHFATPDDAAAPYIEVAELLDSTFWIAPSDALLPVREFDLYDELPAVLESTEPGQGALL